MTGNILVFGSTGQLAQELKAVLPKAEFLDRATADLSKPETIVPLIKRQRYDAVVIAAAYTAVDRAEDESAVALEVNGKAPGLIAKVAAEMGSPVIYVSTDYVFDGSKDGWYAEGDATGPLGVYGRSKLMGEEAVRLATEKHIILRTSWVFSAHGSNFVKTMVRLSSRDELSIVADQEGCPTSARDLAGAIERIVVELKQLDHRFGTYHVASPHATTWYGLAEAVFAEMKSRGLRHPVLHAIKSSEYQTRACRPANSRLSSAKIEGAFGIRLPHWRQSVSQVMTDLLGPISERGDELM
ncbi:MULTISPECIES: dTDP-4-dehydrorhamnose reductase [Sinorhizobium]|uniref:dTDP-4-dehydrorhamnose reductase n=1 Tax=Sinorhizobium TaxID=28105 RepID=UPI000C7C7666|nr:MULTISPECIES: dTDP-4-dehydrorhamnose reductase [Sinorhizobium]MDX1016510.1 dTDP-4-dehydrorhamnose reductase [Sinorhizobium medicae]PLU46989.1 dTDP-4-dehydrorhamnose reductase [Sinorhizobium medicae]RVI88611.1 dTDP-4-dehydrorhamnose reductase [Sinorhizobium meliloti]